MNVIERAELQARLDGEKAPALLEALPPKYFREGHLPGARQLNTDDAVGHAGILGLSPDQAIVVYCASDTCLNSHKAAEALTTAGFGDVSVYVGGKKDWVDAGLPLEKASAAA